MKLNLSPSMLLAALSALSFTIALSSGLEGRQGHVVDTTPTVADCANGSDCKLASSWWNDCQSARVLGLPFDSSSAVRSCLCPPGRAVPSHMDWYSKLRNCIVCVEMTAGTSHKGLPMYIQIEKVAGSPSSSVGYCHGTLSTEEFVEKTKDLVKEKGFPLALPEVVLLPAGGRGEVEHAVTAITLAVPMHTTTPFSRPTAHAHSMSTDTAPTAVPNSLFSTFSAVPFSSALASISAASSSTPTAVPNSLFSTFSAIPFSSVLASISSAMATTSCSADLPSKRSAGETSSPSVTSNPTLKCNHDNCLRAALRSEPAVVSFCATYTKNPTTAGTGFPSCLLPCNNSPVSISSACTCLASHTSSVSSAITTSTSTAAPFPANSTITSSLSSHTVYPTANPTKWISLPASEAVKSCAASNSCRNANIYHDTCLKGNDEEAWKCLCSKWPIAWKTNLNQCTQCLESSLPRFAGNEGLTAQAERVRDHFCQYTGSNKTGAKDVLVAAGAFLTAKYQSSLALFNMTLIDAPYGLPQTTTTASSTPSPTPAPPGKWASLPASKEVVACSQSAECLRAGHIFKTCQDEEMKTGGNAKFCFCNTHAAEWTNSLKACATCLSKALPDSPPSNAPAARNLTAAVVEETRSIYCEPASVGSIEKLQQVGVIITRLLQSPVKFFGMELITEAIPE